MKTRYSFICLICSFILITLSCSDHDDVEEVSSTNPFIKEIVGRGKTFSKYLYNSSGKISECQDIYFYQRFTYDATNRLVKTENASDVSLLSSSATVWDSKQELMTSENSEISHYQLFSYNSSGQLVSIEHYLKKDGKFSYGSKKTYEYDGNKISRVNWHNGSGESNNYQTYEYDEKGNVINTKNYSNHYNGSSNPTLISGATYKYDTKNNPFQIYKETGDPGLYTNPNNIIESTSTTYVEVPGMNNPTTTKTTYEYNSNGYPIKVMDESGSQWEYIY